MQRRNKEKTPQVKKNEEENDKKKEPPLILNLNKLFDCPFGELKFDLVDYLLLSFIAIISSTAHTIDIGKPSSVVFDEVYFGNFTNYYHSGEYYFDIHPPLGKLILYGGSLISRYQAKEVFSSIGSKLNKSEITKLRIWPAAFGAIRAPILYVTLKILDVSPQWCFTAALLISVDNALISESRYVLIDAFLSCFACFSFLATSFISRRPKKVYIFAILGGLAAGATVSIKFTGAGVALTLVFAIFTTYPLVKAIKISIVAGTAGLTLFLAQFFVHFALLPHPGPGCPFHHPDFCRMLKQGKKPNQFSMLVDLLQKMLTSNFAIHVQHSYSSKWWQWPFMLGKGTYLWTNGKNKNLWVVGSPVVWYSGLCGLILWIIMTFFSREVRRTMWILFGYTLSYLPFALIKRVMWNYHYFIPLLFSIIAGAVAASRLRPNAVVVPALLCFGAFATYVIYFPITYGTNLENDKFKKIMFPCWTY